MRKVLIYLLVVFSMGLSTQNKQILYDFNEIPQSLLLNPGTEVDYKWHFGIPLLSHIHFDIGNTGPSVYDLFADDGIDFNTKLRNSLNELSRNDHISVNQQLELLSGGFRHKGLGKETYFSFGIYQETDFFVYYPKDYLTFAYYGNPDPVGKSFNLGDLNLRGEMLTVFHLGVNQKINDKFTLGFRGKIYSSIIDFKSTNNTGAFFTTEGQDNFYEHTFRADLEIQTSGYASLREIESEDNQDGTDQVIKKFKKRALFGGNLGLGFDVGFTYNLSDQLNLTGSIQDIGVIRHSKDVERYTLKGEYSLEGINLLFPEILSGTGTTNEYWQEISDDIEEQLPVDTLNTKYTTWRSPKFNSSLKYSWGYKLEEDCDCAASDITYLNAVGVQAYYRGRPKYPQVAAIVFYYRRLFNVLRFKATYTADSYSFNNLGAGMSAHIGNVNFYLMADNLIGYANLADTSKASIQFGFNYIFPSKTD